MELIDDHPVVRYLVRFQDRTEITESQAATVKDGNTVIWVVRARCLPPSYHPTTKDAEDRYRFNIQAVEAAVPVVGPSRDAALAFVEHGNAQGYLSFGAEAYSALLDDDTAYGPSLKEAAYDEVAELLTAKGQMGEDESVYDAVQRLLATQPAPREDPQLAFPTPPPPSFDSTPGTVEVVGSIYRNGPSADRRLIEEMFGNGAPS